MIGKFRLREVLRSDQHTFCKNSIFSPQFLLWQNFKNRCAVVGLWITIWKISGEKKSVIFTPPVVIIPDPFNVCPLLLLPLPSSSFTELCLLDMSPPPLRSLMPNWELLRRFVSRLRLLDEEGSGGNGEVLLILVLLRFGLLTRACS